VISHAVIGQRRHSQRGPYA